MPGKITIRMTLKFSKAYAAAVSRKMDPPAKNQEALYAMLEAAGLFWDSDEGEWIEVEQEKADPPSELVRLRVWAAGELVSGLADDLEQAMRRCDYRLVERSKPYLCRPPKVLESRVYLTFQKKE